MNKNLHRRLLLLFTIIALFLSVRLYGDTGAVFTAKDLLDTQLCDETQISPDGQRIAFTVRKTRDANEKPGSYYRELYLVSTQTRQVIPFITGNVSIRSLRWGPDSSRLGFITARGEEAKRQVWVIPIDGGEAFQVTHSETDVIDFQWHPQQNQIAYIAESPKDEKEKKLKEKGFEFIFYEENLKPRNLYLVDLSGPGSQARQLTRDKSVWNFVFSPDGKTIAAAVTPRNLVDESYMFKKIYLLDLESQKLEPLTDNPGKLGKFYYFSPDGSKLVYTAALDQKDHYESQVYVIDIKTKEQKNLTIPDFRGHVEWAVWKDPATVLYYAGEGVWSTLSLVAASGGKREIILDSQTTRVTFKEAGFSKNCRYAALVGSTPQIPAELFYWTVGQGQLKQLTNLNPWLSQRKLGKQEVVRYKARDGLEIEGLLVYPADYREGQAYPLIVIVHGGPESQYRPGFLGRNNYLVNELGIAVFYPNVRGSTGFGKRFVGLDNGPFQREDSVKDIGAFLDALAGNPRLDPARFAVAGRSYGGYMCFASSIFYGDRLRGANCVVAISSFVTFLENTQGYRRDLRRVEYGDERDPAQRAKLMAISPLTRAHEIKIPLLVVTGANDPRVPASEADQIIAAVRAQGGEAWHLLGQNEGHGFAKKENADYQFWASLMFWKQTLLAE